MRRLESGTTLGSASAIGTRRNQLVRQIRQRPVLAGALPTRHAFDGSYSTVGAVVIAERQEADGFARQAQGDFSGFSLSANGEGDREDQSDPARLGEVLRDRPLQSVLLIYPLLGRDEDSAPSGPSVPAFRFRREAVEQGMAVRHAGTLLGVPRFVSAVELGSRSGLIGRITLDMKCAGARSAGNPHATCDVAGAGIPFTVRLVRHSQRKRGAMDSPNLPNYGASPQSDQERPDSPSSIGRDLSWVFEKPHRQIVVVMLVLLGTEDGSFGRRPRGHCIAPAKREPESESRS